MSKAVYEKLEDGTTYAGTIPSCPGSVSFGASPYACQGWGPFQKEKLSKTSFLSSFQFKIYKGTPGFHSWMAWARPISGTSNMKRVFDSLLALILIVLLFVPMLVVSLLVKLTSKGPVLYWSDRVGRNNTIFRMPKFRTMRLNTPAVATHLLDNSDQYLTPIGGFLRKLSLDEIPQLFNILQGEISFVGPRPALFNQDDLVELRTSKGIHRLIPGLTGWAQINGRDDLPIPAKVEFDAYYLQHQSFFFDLKILLMTPFKVLRSEGVKH